MKILIAEDDPISRLFLEKTLQKLGHTVTSCKDGRQAWEQFNASQFGVIISDWMMPEMDGLELCRKIRSHPGPCYCYFLMLTAKSSKADFLEAMDAGADDYLTKPADPDEIVIRLRLADRILALQQNVRK